jgi:5-amino-6-(5-phosphoribosylamino)uracil reductase
MAAPFVLLSCAMSVDGYIDDITADPFPLSNAEDVDRADAARAASDATLIGASTLRRGNPRLPVSSQERRLDRIARGLPGYPFKVTVTVTVTGPGDLSPDLTTIHTRFLTARYLPKAAS